MHKLTEKLCKKNGYCSYDIDDIDSIITKFLYEASENLFNRQVRLTITPEECKQQINEILGLQPSSEKEVCSRCAGIGYLPFGKHPLDNPCPDCKSEAPQPKEWCKHWHKTKDEAGWYFNQGAFTLNYDCEIKYAAFCPICGTPRPTPRTLRDDLMIKLRDKIHEWKLVAIVPDGLSADLAEIAEKHFLTNTRNGDDMEESKLADIFLSVAIGFAIVTAGFMLWSK